MTQKDLDNYYAELKKYLASGKVHSIPNSDRAHNATILRLMLDESDTVNMFCGKMSVLRDSFYNQISKDNDEKLGSSQKDLMIQTLGKFLSRPNTRLNIIIEKLSSQNFSDLISSSIFKMGLRSGKISLRKTDNRLIVTEGVSHFTYTKRGIVRIEIEQEPHTGICTVNAPEDMLNILEYNYGVLERTSNPINTVAFL